jgi:hypothetical protein
MQWLLDGRAFDLTSVADEEVVSAGSTRVWEFVNEPNPMGMAMVRGRSSSPPSVPITTKGEPSLHASL